ncbi:MAG: hypothetical protein M3Q44_03220 [bacterium]|nr:hypothetical protein [bacterium]
MTDKFQPSGLNFPNDPPELLAAWEREQELKLRMPAYPTGNKHEVIAKTIPFDPHAVDFHNAYYKFLKGDLLHFIDGTTQQDLENILDKALIFSLEGNHLCGKDTQQQILKEYLENKGFTVLALKNAGYVSDEEIANYVDSVQIKINELRARKAQYRMMEHYDAQLYGLTRRLAPSSTEEALISQKRRDDEDEREKTKYHQYLASSPNFPDILAEIELARKKAIEVNGEHSGEYAWHILQEILQFTLKSTFLLEGADPSHITGTPLDNKNLGKIAVILNRGPITRLVNFAKSPTSARYPHPFMTDAYSDFELLGKSKVKQNPYGNPHRKTVFMPIPITFYIDVEVDELIRRTSQSSRTEQQRGEAIASIKRNYDIYTDASRRMHTFHSDRLAIIDGNTGIEATTAQIQSIIDSRYGSYFQN